MAIMLKRAYPLHLKHRYRHILRLLLRDSRFVGSCIGIAAIAVLIGVSVLQAPHLKTAAGKLEQSFAYSLASSGDYAGWHSYTDVQDRFQASVPCFADTVPQPVQTNTPLGPLLFRNTACLYNVSYKVGNQTLHSQDNFWIKVAPVHYPTDSVGQLALLQEIATSLDPHSPMTPTSLNGLPAIKQQAQSAPDPNAPNPQPNNNYTYYVFGSGNLYLLTTNYRPGSPSYVDRFVGSFRPLK
ncbi:MAG TPA: hypothetical protein VMR75_02550 [Candidatus Saccharimonadales bacterium]|nr:hypothetical protein [Candidatus Saccharimonadales bacterium]